MATGENTSHDAERLHKGRSVLMESLTQEQQEQLMRTVETAGREFFRTPVKAVEVREHPVIDLAVNDVRWEYVVDIVIAGREKPVPMNARRNPDQPGHWLIKPRYDSDIEILRTGGTETPEE